MTRSGRSSCSAEASSSVSHSDLVATNVAALYCGTLKREAATDLDSSLFSGPMQYQDPVVSLCCNENLGLIPAKIAQANLPISGRV